MIPCTIIILVKVNNTHIMLVEDILNVECMKLW